MSSLLGSTPSTRPPAPDQDPCLRPLKWTPPWLCRTNRLFLSLSRSTSGPMLALLPFPCVWLLPRPSPRPSHLHPDPPPIRRLARRASPFLRRLLVQGRCRGRNRCPTAGLDSMVRCKAAPGPLRYNPSPGRSPELTPAPSLNRLPCQGPGSRSRPHPHLRHPPTTPFASSRSSPYQEEPTAKL
jgi:hypothetical protein